LISATTAQPKVVSIIDNGRPIIDEIAAITIGTPKLQLTASLRSWNLSIVGTGGECRAWAPHPCIPESLNKMSVELREIQIASEYDHDGRLILIDGRLVAVMVKLSELHEHLAGRWYLETGYGVLKNEQPNFLDLDSAIEWIRHRLTHDPINGKSIAS